MIEINLLPESGQPSPRRLPRLLRLPPSLLRWAPFGRAAATTRPAARPLRPPARWRLFAALAWLIAAVLAAAMFFSTGSRLSELEVAVHGARLDSVRHAEMRAAHELLLARQDTIARKLDVIQQIDAGRYVWAHILDEVSRALPRFTWLVGISHLSAEGFLDPPRFVIDGRAGNTLALTRLMQDLEASPFVRDVTLVQADQLREDGKQFYGFQLEAAFEDAPPDVIQTVSIFAGEGS